MYSIFEWGLSCCWEVYIRLLWHRVWMELLLYGQANAEYGSPILVLEVAAWTHPQYHGETECKKFDFQIRKKHRAANRYSIAKIESWSRTEVLQRWYHHSFI